MTSEQRILTEIKRIHFIIIKGSIHQEDIRNSKCLCTYNRELKYMKQRTQNYKEKFTIIYLYSEFNTPLSIIDRTSRQRISKETDLNNSVYYCNLIL